MPSFTEYSVTGPQYTGGPESFNIQFFTTQRCVYSVQVKDFPPANIAEYDDAGGKTTVEVGLGDFTSEFSAGRVVYLFVESGSGYVGKAIVESSSFSTNTTVTFTTDLGIGTAVTVIDPDDFLYIPYLPERVFYFKVQDDGTDIAEALYFTPKETGLAEINIGQMCRDYLEDNYDATLDPERNKDFVKGAFLVRSSEESLYTTAGGSAAVLVGNRQFRSPYGDGLAAYMIEQETTKSGGRHLDMFFNRRFNDDQIIPDYIFSPARVWRDPTFANGYWDQFAYYIINSQDTNFSTFYVESNDLDEDGSFLRSNRAESVLRSTGNDIYQFQVDGNGSFGDQHYIETVFSGTATRSNQIRRCVWEVCDEPENPCMVYWRNSLGTLSYWVFGFDRSATKEVKNGGDFVERYIDTTKDLSPGNIYPGGNTFFQETITLREASLDVVQAHALSEILTSREVYVTVSRASSDDLGLRVIPVPNSLQYTSRNLRYRRRTIANLVATPNFYAPGMKAHNTGSLEISLQLPYNTSYDMLRGLDELDTKGILTDDD